MRSLFYLTNCHPELIEVLYSLQMVLQAPHDRGIR
jgi:hypothetical protein